MNRILRTLILCPTVFGSMLSVLLIANTAHAAEPVAQVTNRLECKRTQSVSRLTCERVYQTGNVASKAIVVRPAQQSQETPMLEFTDEESDAAVARFGCDCLVCINAIRQSRGLPPVT